MRELRRGPRVPLRNILVQLVQGSRLVPGDVSLYGVGFQVPATCHLKRGDELEVRLFLPDQVLRATVVVRRIRPAHPRAVGRVFVGAEFEPLDALVANPLDRFIEESALLQRPLQPV